MFAQPAAAYELFVEMKPHMTSEVNRKIYQRSFRYMSRDLKNVQRDWDKVTKYCKRLEIVDDGFVQNMTNEFYPTIDTGVLADCASCKHSAFAEASAVVVEA